MSLFDIKYPPNINIGPTSIWDISPILMLDIGPMLILDIGPIFVFGYRSDISQNFNFIAMKTELSSKDHLIQFILLLLVFGVLSWYFSFNFACLQQSIYLSIYLSIKTLNI